MAANGDAKEKKSYLLNVRFLRQLLIIADDIMHFFVAVLLLLCAALILMQTLPNLLHPNTTSLLHVLNDALLVLIVMELMWPIVKFLKREEFSLNPFLYIGIISSVRRILLVEAEHSLTSRFTEGHPEWQSLWPVLAELGANVGVILLLALALLILSRSRKETPSPAAN